MIKKVIDVVTFKQELHLNEHYRYCGPGTRLGEKIKNMDAIIDYHSKYMVLPPYEFIQFKADGYPYNELDKLSMYHDFMYVIASHAPTERKGKIESFADENLINDCRLLLSNNPDKETKDHTKLVIQLVTCKMNTQDAVTRCHCNLS